MTPAQSALAGEFFRALASVEIPPGTPDSENVACVTGNPPRMITASEVKQARIAAAEWPNRAAPKVKPLVFIGMESDCFVHCDAFGCEYELMVFDTLERTLDYAWQASVRVDGREVSIPTPPQSSFSDAVSAAQADYERRILDALE